MSVVYIGGVPGTGKTLFATYLMRRKFRKENNIFKRLFKRPLYLNVFSNYPIKLYKNIYSYSVSLDDFKDFNKHVPDCDIVSLGVKASDVLKRSAEDWHSREKKQKRSLCQEMYL